MSNSLRLKSQLDFRGGGKYRVNARQVDRRVPFNVSYFADVNGRRGTRRTVSVIPGSPLFMQLVKWDVIRTRDQRSAAIARMWDTFRVEQGLSLNQYRTRYLNVIRGNIVDGQDSQRLFPTIPRGTIASTTLNGYIPANGGAGQRGQREYTRLTVHPRLFRNNQDQFSSFSVTRLVAQPRPSATVPNAQSLVTSMAQAGLFDPLGPLVVGQADTTFYPPTIAQGAPAGLHMAGVNVQAIVISDLIDLILARLETVNQRQPLSQLREIHMFIGVIPDAQRMRGLRLVHWKRMIISSRMGRDSRDLAEDMAYGEGSDVAFETSRTRHGNVAPNQSMRRQLTNRMRFMSVRAAVGRGRGGFFPYYYHGQLEDHLGGFFRRCGIHPSNPTTGRGEFDERRYTDVCLLNAIRRTGCFPSHAQFIQDCLVKGVVDENALKAKFTRRFFAASGLVAQDQAFSFRNALSIAKQAILDRRARAHLSQTTHKMEAAKAEFEGFRNILAEQRKLIMQLNPFLSTTDRNIALRPHLSAVKASQRRYRVARAQVTAPLRHQDRALHQSETTFETECVHWDKEAPALGSLTIDSLRLSIAQYLQGGREVGVRILNPLGKRHRLRFRVRSIDPGEEAASKGRMFGDFGGTLIQLALVKRHFIPDFSTGIQTFALENFSKVLVTQFPNKWWRMVAAQVSEEGFLTPRFAPRTRKGLRSGTVLAVMLDNLDRFFVPLGSDASLVNTTFNRHFTDNLERPSGLFPVRCLPLERYRGREDLDFIELGNNLLDWANCEGKASEQQAVLKDILANPEGWYGCGPVHPPTKALGPIVFMLNRVLEAIESPDEATREQAHADLEELLPEDLWVEWDSDSTRVELCRTFVERLTILKAEAYTQKMRRRHESFVLTQDFWAADYECYQDPRVRYVAAHNHEKPLDQRDPEFMFDVQLGIHPSANKDLVKNPAHRAVIENEQVGYLCAVLRVHHHAKLDATNHRVFLHEQEGFEEERYMFEADPDERNCTTKMFHHLATLAKQQSQDIMRKCRSYRITVGAECWVGETTMTAKGRESLMRYCLQNPSTARRGTDLYKALVRNSGVFKLKLGGGMGRQVGSEWGLPEDEPRRPPNKQVLDFYNARFDFSCIQQDKEFYNQCEITEFLKDRSNGFIRLSLSFEGVQFMIRDFSRKHSMGTSLSDLPKMHEFKAQKEWMLYGSMTHANLRVEGATLTLRQMAIECESELFGHEQRGAPLQFNPDDQHHLVEVFRSELWQGVLANITKWGLWRHTPDKTGLDRAFDFGAYVKEYLKLDVRVLAIAMCRYRADFWAASGPLDETCEEGKIDPLLKLSISGQETDNVNLNHTGPKVLHCAGAVLSFIENCLCVGGRVDTGRGRATILDPEPEPKFSHAVGRPEWLSDEQRAKVCTVLPGGEGTVIKAIDMVAAYPSAMADLGKLRGPIRRLLDHEVNVHPDVVMAGSTEMFVCVQLVPKTGGWIPITRALPVLSERDPLSGGRDWKSFGFNKEQIHVSRDSWTSFRNYNPNYDLEQSRVLGGYKMTDGRCPKLQVYVEKLFARRLLAKAVGNKRKAGTIKLSLNSIYGRMKMAFSPTSTKVFSKVEVLFSCGSRDLMQLQYELLSATVEHRGHPRLAVFYRLEGTLTGVGLEPTIPRIGALARLAIRNAPPGDITRYLQGEFPSDHGMRCAVVGTVPFNVCGDDYYDQFFKRDPRLTSNMLQSIAPMVPREVTTCGKDANDVCRVRTNRLLQEAGALSRRWMEFETQETLVDGSLDGVEDCDLQDAYWEVNEGDLMGLHPERLRELGIDREGEELLDSMSVGGNFSDSNQADSTTPAPLIEWLMHFNKAEAFIAKHTTTVRSCESESNRVWVEVYNSRDEHQNQAHQACGILAHSKEAFDRITSKMPVEDIFYSDTDSLVGTEKALTAMEALYTQDDELFKDALSRLFPNTIGHHTLVDLPRLKAQLQSEAPTRSVVTIAADGTKELGQIPVTEGHLRSIVGEALGQGNSDWDVNGQDAISRKAVFLTKKMYVVQLETDPIDGVKHYAIKLRCKGLNQTCVAEYVRHQNRVRSNESDIQASCDAMRTDFLCSELDSNDAAQFRRVERLDNFNVFTLFGNLALDPAKWERLDLSEGGVCLFDYNQLDGSCYTGAPKFRSLQNTGKLASHLRTLVQTRPSAQLPVEKRSCFGLNC